MGRWQYSSKHGVFTIYPTPNGRYTLSLDNEALGFYHSPGAAADDVYMGATGAYEWDADDEIERPEGIFKWQEF
jgi:hypothetical protein